MPRIDAATVKEHRAAQRQRLLLAARAIMSETGPAALRFGELADRANLARPTVYEYFATRDELFVALMDQEFDTWLHHLTKAVSRATAPEQQIEQYLLAHLRLVKQGRHGFEALFGQAELSVQVRETVGRRHRQILEQLMPAITRLTASNPDLCLELLRGALKSAMAEVTRGKRPVAVARRVAAFLIGGFRALGAAK
jgi:AcrR family transcriptional regulator